MSRLSQPPTASTVPESDGEQACGCVGINGLMQVARERALEVRLLDLRNSGDTAAERSRVVGYGAFALYETRAMSAPART